MRMTYYKKNDIYVCLEENYKTYLIFIGKKVNKLPMNHISTSKFKILYNKFR